MKRKRSPDNDEIENLEQEKYELNDKLESLQSRIEKAKSEQKITALQDEIDETEEEFIDVSDRLDMLKSSHQRQKRKMKRVS